MTDNLIQLDTLRIDRKAPRKCVCEHGKRSFTVDTRNREVTCGCGITVDPYEAMEELATSHERHNEQHKRMSEQAEQWKREKPHSVLFKELERHYQKGTMLPYCPSCGVLIELKELNAWGNAEFYRRRKKMLQEPGKTT